MSTAVATAPGPPMHHLDRNPSPRSYPPLAPSTAAPSERNGGDVARSHNGTPPDGGRISPRSYGATMPVDEAALMLDRLRSGGNHPKIIVKKEPPSSPSMQAGARHRPRKLDLNLNTSSMPGPNSVNSRPSATPMTARDTLGTIQDVGLACLSPGFQTQDPTMREQLQRSLSVRDQQRSIIEQRLLKSAKGDHPDAGNSTDSLNSAGLQPLGSKKRPPPGLSIVPPPAERFANERIVQSAPLNQTFTGRHDHHAAHRQASGQSHLGPSHLSHQPSMQTSNRLPPISDVFAPNELRPDAARPPFLHTNSTSSHGPPMPSPSYPPQTAHPMSHPSGYSGFERPREFRSAEEAVHEMTGGREDLMPKIVHYGGHQPPTPPSPHPQNHENLTPHKFQVPGFAGRRRSRHEYEEGSSPPLGNGRGPRVGPFGEERDSPATQRAKKEKFLSLCSEAWDLFHS